MSRFSNRTARVVGYAAFSAIGAFAYLSYRPAEPPAAAEPLPRLVPVPELTSTAAYATELSAVLTHPRADDPPVNLAPLPHPAWQLDRSMAELQQLEGRRVDPLPRDYPSPQIRPITAVREQASIQGPPGLQLPGLAPEPRAVASDRWHRWGGDTASGGEREMVPLTREGATLAPPVEVAAAEDEMSWSSRGMVLLRNAGQNLLGRAAPPPAEPHGRGGPDAPATRLGPSLAGYSVAKPVLETPPLAASDRVRQFIDQPQPPR